MGDQAKDHGMLDKAKDSASELAGKAAETASGLVEKAEPLVGKAKEATGDLSAKAEPVLDKARVAAGDLVEKAQPVVDKAVEAGGGLLDKAKDLLGSKKTDAGPSGTGTTDGSTTGTAAPVKDEPMADPAD